MKTTPFLVWTHHRGAHRGARTMDGPSRPLERCSRGPAPVTNRSMRYATSRRNSGSGQETCGRGVRVAGRSFGAEERVPGGESSIGPGRRTKTPGLARMWHRGRSRGLPNTNSCIGQKASRLTRKRRPIPMRLGGTHRGSASHVLYRAASNFGARRNNRMWPDREPTQSRRRGCPGQILRTVCLSVL